MAVGWAALADTIPIYALYALLFADAGLSDAQISTLFLIWSTVGIVAGVPSGALADRFSRRAALVVAGVLQAAGYVLWVTVPGYAAFAGGFVLWGLGGAFGSGALEALLYDGLASASAEEQYPRLYGRVTAVGLLSQLPAAAAATVLFSTGGYALVGWMSVACCLAAAAVATRLPDPRREPPKANTHSGEDGTEPDYFTILRAGVAEVARRPAVRGAVVAVALLGGLDGLEEYFPLLAHDWGVATSMVPLAVLGIPLAGAAGASLGGSASRLRPRTLAMALTGAVAVFSAAGMLRRPVGMVGIAVAYGLYRLVLVVIDTRLQQQIEGRARATVTSVASFGTDLSAIALYAAWAMGQPLLVGVIALAVAAHLPRLSVPGSSAHKSAPCLRPRNGGEWSTSERRAEAAMRRHSSWWPPTCPTCESYVPCEHCRTCGAPLPPVNIGGPRRQPSATCSEPCRTKLLRERKRHLGY
ncbi:MAG: MFS transporter [Acidimicrobiales bacterium]